MIRKFQPSDIKRVMEIWLKGNEEAHSFITKDYWKANFEAVQEQILQSEVFVYEKDEEIYGFIGIVDSYIAGIFVDKKYRSHGVGKGLIDHVKQEYAALSLGVYEKNVRAVQFYLREGFTVASAEPDKETGETAYTMIWKL